MNDWKPAFDGQRPPFQPGNDAAIKHGAYSPRAVDPLAEQIRAELLDNPGCPDHLRLPVFAEAVAAWARAEARCRLLGSWLTALKPSKALLSVLTALERAENAAARHRAALGLDPTSAARLARDMATSRYLTDRTSGPERLAARGAELAARDIAALNAANGEASDGE